MRRSLWGFGMTFGRRVVDADKDFFLPLRAVEVGAWSLLASSSTYSASLASRSSWVVSFPERCLAFSCARALPFP